MTVNGLLSLCFYWVFFFLTFTDSESFLIRLLDRITKGIDLKFIIQSDRVLDSTFVPTLKSSTTTTPTIPSLWGVQNLRGHFTIPQRRISTAIPHSGGYNISKPMNNFYLTNYNVTSTSVNSNSAIMNSLLNNYKTKQKPRFAHLVCSVGLLVVVLDSVGQLTQRFPHLGKASLDALIGFLLDPSPVLSRLNRQIDRLQHSKSGIMVLIETMKVSC